MKIDGSVGTIQIWQKARKARADRESPATRESVSPIENGAQDLNRRATDQAESMTGERRGIEPTVRSRSTVIVYDGRSVDRRQTRDRRQRSVMPEPSSEFVTQVVARELMLLDLRPDPIETREARAAYRDDTDKSDGSKDGGLDVSV